MLNLIDDWIARNEMAFQCCLAMNNKTFNIIDGHRVGCVHDGDIAKTMISETIGREEVNDNRAI